VRRREEEEEEEEEEEGYILRIFERKVLVETEVIRSLDWMSPEAGP
jgi:hypothetical protein